MANKALLLAHIVILAMLSQHTAAAPYNQVVYTVSLVFVDGKSVYNFPKACQAHFQTRMIEWVIYNRLNDNQAVFTPVIDPENDDINIANDIVGAFLRLDNATMRSVFNITNFKQETVLSVVYPPTVGGLITDNGVHSFQMDCDVLNGWSSSSSLTLQQMLSRAVIYLLTGYQTNYQQERSVVPCEVLAKTPAQNLDINNPTCLLYFRFTGNLGKFTPGELSVAITKTANSPDVMMQLGVHEVITYSPSPEVRNIQLASVALSNCIRPIVASTLASTLSKQFNIDKKRIIILSSTTPVTFTFFDGPIQSTLTNADLIGVFAATTDDSMTHLIGCEADVVFKPTPTIAALGALNSTCFNLIPTLQTIPPRPASYIQSIFNQQINGNGEQNVLAWKPTKPSTYDFCVELFGPNAVRDTQTLYGILSTDVGKATLGVSSYSTAEPYDLSRIPVQPSKGGDAGAVVFAVIAVLIIVVGGGFVVHRRLRGGRGLGAAGAGYSTIETMSPTSPTNATRVEMSMVSSE